MNISVSEINSYLRCKRAWDLTSSNRQSLRHKVTPKMFFVIGNAVHEAIDAQASGDDPYEFFEEYVSRERADRKAAYEEQVGSSPWKSEMEEFESSVNLARSLVEQYFSEYGAENPLESLGLKYIATEVPFSIPLRGLDIHFVGTFDGITTDLATETKFWLVENKTYDRRPNMEDFWRGNQPVGYSWAFRALTGQTPAGMVYNGIAKHLIDTPKTLQSGELSQNKQAKVTLKSFMKAIYEGGRNPEKYLDYLVFLEERERNGDDRFFFREIQSYGNIQLDNWERSTLRPIAFELSKPHKEIGIEINVYPNYTSCRGCLVKDLCTAMDMDEDFQAVADARYEVKTYGTMDAVNGVTPSPVANAAELVELLKGH